MGSHDASLQGRVDELDRGVLRLVTDHDGDSARPGLEHDRAEALPPGREYHDPAGLQVGVHVLSRLELPGEANRLAQAERLSQPLQVASLGAVADHPQRRARVHLPQAPQAVDHQVHLLVRE